MRGGAGECTLAPPHPLRHLYNYLIPHEQGHPHPMQSHQNPNPCFTLICYRQAWLHLLLRGTQSIPILRSLKKNDMYVSNLEGEGDVPSIGGQALPCLQNREESLFSFCASLLVALLFPWDKAPKDSPPSSSPFTVSQRAYYLFCTHADHTRPHQP